MANIFSFLFGGGRFASTEKYEKSLKREKESYIRFTNDASSEHLLRYNELDKLVHSGEFKTKVNNLKKEKQYKKSVERNLFDEYVRLQKDREIKWYFEALKQKNFKTFEEWTLTFEDDFETSLLNANKWMTGYYWGKALMNDNYVLAGEKQYFKDYNISVQNSILRLTTQKDTVRGKSWNPAIGFLEKEFEYSSALISTGQSFRQKYGRFEAKVRFNKNYPVVNAFWMLGEKMTPQIDIFKSTNPKGKSVESGIHTMDSKNKVLHLLKNISGTKFGGHFYIYSLEWTSDLLVWKINGTEVHRETKNIPNEPMYLTFCTTLPENPNSGQIPAYMEIDWVRCYQKA
ncbi:MAG: glycoside hydrolase family 16 protein [Cytophagaceae bacterium]|jgi:beta-glucanase (GH16 family)|nr:glycoside hydrolase family 16 protein [Cytophagaceae bacterium]